MSTGNAQFLWFVGAFVAGGALVWMGRPCPECSVPDSNAALVDSLRVELARADSAAAAFLSRPEPKPVTIIVHERTQGLLGAPVDSLFGILDAMPSAE